MRRYIRIAVVGAILVALAWLAHRALALGYTTVRAPIEGQVMQIAVQEGQTVTAMQSTFGVSTAIGVGFGLMPAQRAARLSTVDALARE